MTPKKTIKLSPLELKAMEALWNLGRASIREILEQLHVGKTLAYTTVQTLVYRLEAKEALQKLRKIGNAHIFVPVIARRQAYDRLMSDFLELFGGSPWPVIHHLVETGTLTLEDLPELKRIIEERETRREGPEPEDSKPQ